MIIFTNDKSTKFCQITLHIKRFICKRKVVPFFCLTVYMLLAPKDGSFMFDSMAMQTAAL